MHVITAMSAIGGFLAGVTLILGIFLKVINKNVKDFNYRKLLFTGREPAPGIPEILPLGERLENLEQSINTLHDQSKANNNAIRQLDQKLDKIMKEFSPNGGNSLRDKINQLSEQLPSETGEIKAPVGSAKISRTRRKEN
ncbi:MAG: hypothetical protein QXL94_00470 [Candidatus Parvarchaeum sp.]